MAQAKEFYDNTTCRLLPVRTEVMKFDKDTNLDFRMCDYFKAMRKMLVVCPSILNSASTSPRLLSSCGSRTLS